MPQGAQFGVNATSAYGAMGYIAGISKTIQTTAYIGAVLDYTHSKLSVHFDAWMDAMARADPRSFQHVYEWPTQYQQYHETVGISRFRLWKHTFSGNSRNRTAGFEFLPSVRPTPVDPILLVPGPDGEVVKQNVHIFVLKATVMEYGTHIEVTPKLSKFLAYVGRDGQSGQDPGWHHARDNEDGSAINFSKGPVTFDAGGNVTKGKFTEAFITWWSTQASSTFDTEIAPVLQADLVQQSKLNESIKLGKSNTKTFSVEASAGEGQRTFEQAEAIAAAQMKSNQEKYIKAAAIRRFNIYGE